MTKAILVIAEQVGGIFRKVSFEAVSAARQLAAGSAAQVVAVAAGSGIEQAALQLGAYGADRIVLADDPALAELSTEAYARILTPIIETTAPELVLAGATSQGRDLAARLAARLNAALAGDCVAVKLEDGVVKATRPMYGGKVLADVVLSGTPAFVTIRPNSFGLGQQAGTGTLEKASVDLGTLRTQIVGRQMESGKIELTEADVIVSGGRGMGGADFSVVEELAALLGGAVGTSRSAVDEGWRPVADQVGQTGKTVAPNLYIACGISGAIQHLAGMSSSKVIVAINKDPEAAMLTRADYSIVGDLFEVVPALTAEIRKLKG